MYLSHVHIADFRNFEKLDVELLPGLNVIVGENNIGKTNLIDAIRIALAPSASGANRLWPRKSDLHRTADGRVANSFRISLTFSELTEDQMADFIECLSGHVQSPNTSELQINYRWTWNDTTGRYSEKRWSGSNESEVLASEHLQGFILTYLQPLRDALSYLVAGRSSRIGLLLRTLSTQDEQESLNGLFEETNKKLRTNGLIQRAVNYIQANLRAATGNSLSQEIGLVPTSPEFDSIVNSLRMILRLQKRSVLEGEEPFTEAEIEENGLGYNNLLYIATILAELSRVSEGDFPLLIVEEPEAHLHPQLTTLLADFLLEQSEPHAQSRIQAREMSEFDFPGHPAIAKKTLSPQILITTHSPVLASHLPPDHLIVLHHPLDDSSRIKPASLWKCGLDQQENRKLQRLLDVTKATVFFAKGVVLVEGICEQLLVPEMARRLGIPLEDIAVSVIATHGVDFLTLTKLFGKAGLEIKCAVITDADCEIGDGPSLIPEARGEHWMKRPRVGTVSPRVQNLQASSTAPYVCIFSSQVTLEYDLALANGGKNAALMADIWAAMCKASPRTFTRDQVNGLATPEDKACLVWQALCLRDSGRYKTPFAHELSLQLARGAPSLKDFATPPYIQDAIRFSQPITSST